MFYERGEIILLFSFQLRPDWWKEIKVFDEKSGIFPGFVFSIRPCDPHPGNEMGGWIGIITRVPFATFRSVQWLI